MKIVRLEGYALRRLLDELATREGERPIYLVRVAFDGDPGMGDQVKIKVNEGAWTEGLGVEEGRS